MTCEVLCGDAAPLSGERPRTLLYFIFGLLQYRFCRQSRNRVLGGLRMALRTSDHLFHSPCARRAAIALSLAVVFTVFASAQDTNGRIIGTVTDTQARLSPAPRSAFPTPARMFFRTRSPTMRAITRYCNFRSDRTP